MKCLVLGLMIVNLICSLSFAKNRLLVSNFQTNSEFVSNEDLLILTERVIVIISEIKTYDLITKENILTLLPPDQNLEECIGECEIETGRLVGANKVISGWVVKSKKLYQLTIKLHDTRTGVLEIAKLISATNFKGVLSELQNRRSSLLQTDKEAERDLEGRLALIRSSRLEKEERKRKILQKEAKERLRLEEKKRNRVKLMLKKKKKRRLPPLIQGLSLKKLEWKKKIGREKKTREEVPEGAYIPPKLKRKVTPMYTVKALALDIEGHLSLMISIDTKGRVYAAKITRPLGYGLDQVGLKTVKLWRYAPAMLNGKPVKSERRVAMNFVINN